MWNANIVAQTAKSWQAQPTVWNDAAVAAATGERITASPSRARASSWRAGPSPSSASR